MARRRRDMKPDERYGGKQSSSNDSFGMRIGRLIDNSLSFFSWLFRLFRKADENVTEQEPPREIIGLGLLSVFGVVLFILLIFINPNSSASDFFLNLLTEVIGVIIITALFSVVFSQFSSVDNKVDIALEQMKIEFRESLDRMEKSIESIDTRVERIDTQHSREQLLREQAEKEREQN